MQKSQIVISDDVLASRGKRLANFLLDYIIQLILVALLTFLIVIVSELTSSYGLYNALIVNDSFLASYVLGAFILLLYYIIIETITARTIGKYITQTKVIMADGSPPHLSDILIRTLCRLIPFEQFSFLDDRGKGWHDSLSKTYVIDIKKYEDKLRSDDEIKQIGNISKDH